MKRLIGILVFFVLFLLRSLAGDWALFNAPPAI